ncbi:hypothetical protein B0H19DRAFT_1076681 [Mycena capillaripes]|nr:hypothetical protein B0H19DRAFT_1076681 [Mycena capillaripes]
MPLMDHPFVPPDPQTLPWPSSIPEAPNCLFYGWILEPDLFGPEPITLIFDDGSSKTLMRPTTTAQAIKTFQLVAGGLPLSGLPLNPPLLSAITIEQPLPESPWFAFLAEASEAVGIRSVLDGADNIPPAAHLEKLQDTLHLLKKPEWIQSRRFPSMVSGGGCQDQNAGLGTKTLDDPDSEAARRPVTIIHTLSLACQPETVELCQSTTRVQSEGLEGSGYLGDLRQNVYATLSSFMNSPDNEDRDTAFKPVAAQTIKDFLNRIKDGWKAGKPHHKDYLAGFLEKFACELHIGSLDSRQVVSDWSIPASASSGTQKRLLPGPITGVYEFRPAAEWSRTTCR